MGMKLGSETGSLVNHFMANEGGAIPAVGDGVTVLLWTDRHATTVIDVDTSGKRPVITVQRDHAKRIDENGMSEAQEYEYTPDPQGIKYTFRFDPKQQCWRQLYRNDKGNLVFAKSGCRITVGLRREYHDFTF